MAIASTSEMQLTSKMSAGIPNQVDDVPADG
jgi:hypothetical protein